MITPLKLFGRGAGGRNLGGKYQWKALSDRLREHFEKSDWSVHVAAVSQIYGNFKA